jgi:LPXTG-site transpeptidase (sortase) family protein
MPGGYVKKIRYYSSVCALYGLTLLLALFVFKPHVHSGVSASSFKLPVELSAQADKPIISGKPMRVVIASLGIDLPIDEGLYNASDGSWSLSGYHAQFATLSPLANDSNGNTFIYGHNNKYVFGPLKKIAPGDNAQVYTDNGHIFLYKFVSTNAVTPDDTSVLNYQGPPIMTIQTCSGAWNEQRQMYVFSFDKVAQ